MTDAEINTLLFISASPNQFRCNRSQSIPIRLSVYFLLLLLSLEVCIKTLLSAFGSIKTVSLQRFEPRADNGWHLDVHNVSYYVTWLWSSCFQQYIICTRSVEGDHIKNLISSVVTVRKNHIDIIISWIAFNKLGIASHLYNYRFPLHHLPFSFIRHTTNLIAQWKRWFTTQNNLHKLDSGRKHTALLFVTTKTTQSDISQPAQGTYKGDSAQTHQQISARTGTR